MSARLWKTQALFVEKMREPMPRLNLHGHLNFNEGVARQSRNANGGADVAACIAKNLHEQIGSAIDDFGRILEAGDGVDVAIDADNGLDGVEQAEVTAKYGELSKSTGSGSGVAFLDRAVQSQHAGDDAGSIRRNDAGKKHDVADRASGDVIAAGSRRWGKGDRELLQASFGSGRHEVTFLLKNIATL